MSSGVIVASGHSISGSRNVSDASFVSTVSSLDFPVLEPLMMHDLTRSASSLSAMDSPLETHATGKGGMPDCSITGPTGLPAAPPFSTTSASPADLTSPLWGLSDHSLAQQKSTSRRLVDGKLSSMAISGIVADITSSIAEFPTKMLCLDTPCIVAIRHDMHADKTVQVAQSSAASSPVSPLSPSSAYARRNAEPKIKKSASVLCKGFVRGKPAAHISNMLKAPLPLPLSLCAGSPAPAPSPPPPHTRNTSSESIITLLRSDRSSQTIDLFPFYRNDLDPDLHSANFAETQQGEGLKCPDLSAIATIFPESDSWWQSCLLAHLLAYNYLHILNSAPLPSPVRGPSSAYGRCRMVPAKAARTMGISNMAAIGNEETTYSKALDDLEK